MRLMNRYVVGLVTVLSSVSILAACSAAAAEWSRAERGVVVHPTGQGAAPVRLEVVSDGIIRVSADPDGDFARTKSLMRVEGGAMPAKFDVQEADGKVRVSTSRVVAEVSLRDGRVSFLDKNGKPIVSEVAGGRTFTPLQVDGKDYLSVRQRFESPDSEAIYGFGQHQQGCMNQ